jgi:hypothetical protein
VNVGRAHKLDRTNDYEHQDTWLYPNYRAWVDDTGGKPLSSRRFTGLLKDLFENQLRLEGVEHKDDNKGSRFYGIRFRTYSDMAEPLLITKHPPPVTDVTGTVTDETRASDVCDACDGFLLSLYGYLPTPCVSGAPPRGVGVSIEELCNNPSLTSHPSLLRTLDVTKTSHPSSMRENGSIPQPSLATEPLSEGCPAVGDWCYLFSEKGIQQNATPYRVTAIEQGPDGHWYAQFHETATGWRLDQCEKAEPLTPGEAFDALYEGMLDTQEEAQMRGFFPPPAHETPQSPALASQPLAPGLPLHCSGTAQACPQCGANSWYQRLTYRLCQRCQYKDGLTPQEIREQQ